MAFMHCPLQLLVCYYRWAKAGRNKAYRILLIYQDRPMQHSTCSWSKRYHHMFCSDSCVLVNNCVSISVARYSFLISPTQHGKGPFACHAFLALVLSLHMVRVWGVWQHKSIHLPLLVACKQRLSWARHGQCYNVRRIQTSIQSALMAQFMDQGKRPFVLTCLCIYLYVFQPEFNNTSSMACDDQILAVPFSQLTLNQALN